MAMTHLTILTKNNLFSFLGLVRGQLIEEDSSTTSPPSPRDVTAVIKLDPREGKPWLKQFETGGEAVENYEVAVGTSLDRGWSVVYRGRPLMG